MELKQLTATFGALDRQTLVLGSGLQLIQAPNGSGKTTWCAFLRAMLYGLPARDRRTGADGRRYLPWSGAAMEGRMDLTAGGEALTVFRRTRSPSAPMGAFSAVRTATGQSVPGLDSLNCGQVLTGVPREIYERSAFIAQSSLAVDQSPGLERRIATLLAAGEGDAPSDAFCPGTEEETDRLERRLARSRILQRQIAQAEAALSLLEQQEQQLAGEIFLREEALPARSELAALKSAAGSVQVNRLTAYSLHRRLALREQETAAAQAEADAFPLFAGLTAREARIRAETDQRTCRTLRRRGKLAQALLLLALFFLLLTALPPLLRRPLPLPLTAAGSALFLLSLAAGAVLCIRASQQRRDLIAAYGSENFTRLSDAYAAAYALLTECRSREREVRQRCEALDRDMARAEETVLSAARRLSPQVSTLTEAAAAIDRALARRNRPAAAPENPAPQGGRENPAAAPEELPSLRARLEEIRRRLAEQRGALAGAREQLRLTGTPDAIEAALAEARRRAEQTAVPDPEAPDGSAAAPPDGFAPALAKKTAKYFAKLTKGQYNTVLLNRDLEAGVLEASVLEAGGTDSRPLRRLSQGTADQFYLALRLAVCDLLLPEPQSAPLVLDDALANFDDARMAAALDLLAELAQRRQILLFTCHAREAAYLRQAHPGQFGEVSL